MASRDLISIHDFCSYHHAEFEFIYSLEEAGLIQFVQIKKEKFIDQDQLEQLEKMVRLYNDLDVNIPGIEVIIHLLEQMEQVQQKIRLIENKLRFYE